MTTAGAQPQRQPEDLRTWELVCAYRAARVLAAFQPPAHLAKQLANYMCTTEGVLKGRGHWDATVDFVRDLGSDEGGL